MKQWCVYILQCSDKKQSLYTGMTNDIARRLLAHQTGKGAKFTKGRGRLLVIGIFVCDDKSSALKLEHKIKQLSRKNKLELCNEAAPLSTSSDTEKLLYSLRKSD